MELHTMCIVFTMHIASHMSEFNEFRKKIKIIIHLHVTAWFNYCVYELHVEAIIIITSLMFVNVTVMHNTVVPSYCAHNAIKVKFNFH